MISKAALHGFKSKGFNWEYGEVTNGDHSSFITDESRKQIGKSVREYHQKNPEARFKNKNGHSHEPVIYDGIYFESISACAKYLKRNMSTISEKLKLGRHHHGKELRFASAEEAEKQSVSNANEITE